MQPTINDEISEISVQSPHLVILGAGASRASFPKGDKNGRKLPLMDDLINVVGLENIGALENQLTKNFEDIYSDLYSANNIQLPEIERTVYNYFEAMEIPEETCIYDNLILSLRKKDYIATFNWDPLLLLSYYRNSKFTNQLPRLLFLHGNVGVGFCCFCNTAGVAGNKCSTCKKYFTSTKLLYPIKTKDYHSESFIKIQWDQLEGVLKNAFMVTIFGYGAPKSDIEAIKLLLKGWGNSKDRDLEEIEIIDIRDEAVIFSSWERFIHSTHYQIHKKFSESWIARHPRRTGEAHFNQNMDAKFLPDNFIVETPSLIELQNQFVRLLEIEKLKIDS